MARPIAGQGALLPLPASPFSSELSVESYEIPSHLKGERKTMKDAVDGFEVLKVSKVGCYALGAGSDTSVVSWNTCSHVISFWLCC